MSHTAGAQREDPTPADCQEVVFAMNQRMIDAFTFSATPAQE
jgi:hypothetical protein